MTDVIFVNFVEQYRSVSNFFHTHVYYIFFDKQIVYFFVPNIWAGFENYRMIIKPSVCLNTYWHIPHNSW